MNSSEEVIRSQFSRRKIKLPPLDTQDQIRPDGIHLLDAEFSNTSLPKIEKINLEDSKFKGYPNCIEDTQNERSPSRNIFKKPPGTSQKPTMLSLNMNSKFENDDNGNFFVPFLKKRFSNFHSEKKNLENKKNNEKYLHPFYSPRNKWYTKKREEGGVKESVGSPHWNKETSSNKMLFPVVHLKEVYQSPSKENTLQDNSELYPPESSFSKETLLKDKATVSKLNSMENPVENEKEPDTTEFEKLKHPRKKNSKMLKVIERQKEHKERILKKKPITTIRESLKITSFVILPDDMFKKNWTGFVAILLFFTAIVTPFRVSFIDIDSFHWVMIDLGIDLLFTIDIVINFFSAYVDNDDNLIVDKKKISFTYLKTWFFLDLISIFPISLILTTSNDYDSLTRLARLPKLYRLLKITKLARMFKMAKEKGKFLTYFNDILKLTVGLERLFYFMILMFLMCHISACMWYLLAKMEDFNPQTWVVRYNLQDSYYSDKYCAAFFWALTVITTMGDSAIKAETFSERFMSILLMCIGVCAYSFALGSLTSVLTSLDAKEAKLKEKLKILDQMRVDYSINYKTYIKLKKALKYDHSKNETDKFELLKELPQNLSFQLSAIIHEDLINQIPFFRKRSAHFIAFIGPHLRLHKIGENEYFYKKGDPIEAIYFLVKGRAAFVIKGEPDVPYIYIDEGFSFGETDFIHNFSRQRKHTVKAVEECEVLMLKTEDLYHLDLEFPDILSELFEKAKSGMKGISITRKKAVNFLKEHKFELQCLKSQRSIRVDLSDAPPTYKKQISFQKSMQRIQELRNPTIVSLESQFKTNQSLEETSSSEEISDPSTPQKTNQSIQSKENQNQEKLPTKILDERRHSAAEGVGYRRYSIKPSNWDQIKDKIGKRRESVLNPVQSIQENHNLTPRHKFSQHPPEGFEEDLYFPESPDLSNDDQQSVKSNRTPKMQPSKSKFLQKRKSVEEKSPGFSIKQYWPLEMRKGTNKKDAMDTIIGTRQKIQNSLLSAKYNLELKSKGSTEVIQSEKIIPRNNFFTQEKT